MANTQDQNGLKQTQVAVVIVPLPAQGHLNQLLHLSRIISSYDLPVHYVSTAVHTRQAMARVQGWDPNSAANMHFHQFSIPPFHSPPPNPNAPTKFPVQLIPLLYASSNLREPVGELLRSLSTTHKRVIVVHDSLMGSAVQDVPSLHNVESYCFQSTSALSMIAFHWLFHGKPLPEEMKTGKEDSITVDGCATQEFLKFIVAQPDFREFNSGYIFNTSRSIEGPYLDWLAKYPIDGAEKQWAIGPFNPITIGENKNSNKRHPCLDWLDKQGPNSVIFVSFGTTISLSDDEVKEIANGLEESMEKFIWVLRDADKGDVFGEVRKAELPEGYEERVRERGIVVRDWAPQLEILAHSSTGGFVSHCGWNSCIESITMGVPMAAWPMHSDQPVNSVLVAEFLKIGLYVREWKRRDDLVTGGEVAKAVKTLMGSAEGEEMRKRAAEYREEVRKAVAEGGITRLELESFIAHITR